MQTKRNKRQHPCEYVCLQDPNGPIIGLFGSMCTDAFMLALTDLTTWLDFILPMFCLFVWLRQLLRGLKSQSELFFQGPGRWLVVNGCFLSIDGCGIMDILSAYIVLFYAFHWYFKNILKKLKCKFFEDSFTLWQCDLFSKTWHHKTQMTATNQP